MEADALTNEGFFAFDAAGRVQVVPEKLGFQVIPHLMAAAKENQTEKKMENEMEIGVI